MRLNKSAVLFAGVLTAASLSAGPVSASTAAAPAKAASVSMANELKFGKVFYNANGNDVRTNAWKEHFDLHNTGGPLNVKGWFTQDAWADGANGDKADAGDCNTAIFTAENLPYLKPSALGADDLMLPAGEYIRVYTGGGRDRTDDGQHSLAINKLRCGYNGHYLGNGGDTIYVKKADGGAVAKFSYSFEYGYYVQ